MRRKGGADAPRYIVWLAAFFILYNIALLVAFFIVLYIPPGPRLKHLYIPILFEARHYDAEPKHLAILEEARNVSQQVSYNLEILNYSAPLSSLTLWGGDTDPKELPQHGFLLRPANTAAVGTLWIINSGHGAVATDAFWFMFAVLAGLSDAARPAVLIMDYPGSGANSGTPTQASVLASQVSAICAVVHGLPAEKLDISIFGHSLGTAAASQLAAWLVGKTASQVSQGAACLRRLRPQRLFLSSPMTSIPEAMSQAQKSLLIRMLWWYLTPPVQKWPNSEWVPMAARAGWRTAIVAATGDPLIPANMGRSMRDDLQRAGLGCDFVEVPNDDHNYIYQNTTLFAELMGLRERSPTPARTFWAQSMLADSLAHLRGLSKRTPFGLTLGGW